MEAMLWLALLVALMNGPRERKPITKAQVGILVVATTVLGALTAGLAFGGYF